MKPFVVALSLLMGAASSASLAQDKPITPSPSTKSDFFGFDRYDFEWQGRSCILVVPQQVAAGRPWIWRAGFFGDPPQVDVALLKAGFHVACVDIDGLFASPEAMEIWDDFYKHATSTFELSRKPVLEGMSRGGLPVYLWAAKNPEQVACIYADAPVCDIKSWPAGKLAGRGNPQEWINLLKAYQLTEEEALAAHCNPIDHLEPLAEAKVPLLHVVGDADVDVPVAENTAVVEQKYTALGGPIQVIHKPGVGHQPHSLDDPTPIVEFILSCVNDPKTHQ